MARQLDASGNQSTSIVKQNIAVEVYVAKKNKDVEYPKPEKLETESTDWIYKSRSRLFLPAESLGGKLLRV